MKELVREDPKVMAAAERQMRVWAHQEEIGAIGTRVDRPHRPKSVGCYIALSREAGAGGSEIAQLLGERLGWQVLDRALLEHVADQARVDPSVLKLVDETETNWVYDVLGVWMDAQLVPHQRYVAYLTRVVMQAARLGQVVFVGRGASFLLPRHDGVNVRVIAPLDFRVERVSRLRGLNAVQAKRYIEETDRGRKEFVKRFFHHDVDDPHHYDLVLNSAHFGLEGSVEQVLTAARAKLLVSC